MSLVIIASLGIGAVAGVGGYAIRVVTSVKFGLLTAAGLLIFYWLGLGVGIFFGH